MFGNCVKTKETKYEHKYVSYADVDVTQQVHVDVHVHVQGKQHRYRCIVFHIRQSLHYRGRFIIFLLIRLNLRYFVSASKVKARNF